MKKLTRWAFILGLVYVAMTLYTEGTDEAFGGTFSWMARTTDREAEAVLSHTSAYTSDVPEGSTHEAVPITDAVRDRVTAHMKTASQRTQDPDSY